jgi:glutamate:GABA antiporter
LATVGTDFVKLETAVQARGVVLRKELGFIDLLLAQVLLVVVPDFFGTAAKAGPSHVILWLVAIVLFFIPQALVVSHLNQRLPLEGGLYEWARLAFNDGLGFLVGWNLWLYVVLYAASIGLVSVNFLAYALPARAASAATNKWAIAAASVAIIALLMLVARFGLGVGKWVTNVGSLFTILVIGVVAVVPLAHSWRGPALPDYHPLRLVAPSLNLFSLSVFSKMTFGALCGFEYVAIFGGESRNPSRNISRAIFITAPLIAALYIFGTSGILAFISPEAVDVIAPIPQALTLGLHSMAFAEILVPLVILLLFSNYLASFCINFTANTRLPMVAGWDNLLPGWFSRLHATYRTPVNSILFLGGVTLAASLGVLIGVGQQEAFTSLQIWGFTFYGLAYLALFAVPLLAKKETKLRPGLWLQAAAISGFAVTLLFVLSSAFPIIPVVSQSAYTAKTIAVVLGANIVGIAVYYWGRRRQLVRS